MISRASKEALTDTIDTATQSQHQRFRQGANIEELVHQRARLLDQLLGICWQHFGFDGGISLVAVGGYGRGELHPHSDIDLLLLLAEDNSQLYQSRIEQFLTLLWDLKLNIGHSVRTLEQCVECAEADITVATSLMESRTLCGE